MYLMRFDADLRGYNNYPLKVDNVHETYDWAL